MKKILASLVLVASLCAGHSFAEEQPFRKYIGLDLGWSHGVKFKKRNNIYMSDPQTNTAIIGVNAGIYATDNFRFELSVARFLNMEFKQQVPISSVASLSYATKMKSDYGMLSGYYDFQFSSERFRPYLGVGLGVSHLKGGYNMSVNNGGNVIGTLSKKIKARKNFAYKLVAGTVIKLSGNVRMDLSYNFTNLGKIYFYNSLNGNTTKVGKLKMHSIMFGPKIEF